MNQDEHIERPPGLGRKLKPIRGKLKGMTEAAHKHWDQLPGDFRDLLKNYGMGKKESEKPQDIKEILKQHMASMSEELKQQLTGYLEPPPKTNVQSATQQLKTTVGQLKDLTHKRSNAQNKVDHTKELYKIALQELQDLQNQIEEAQKTLKKTTEEYGRLSMEQQLKEEAEDTKVEEKVMWDIIQKAGVNITEDQQKEIKKLMVETQPKRRKCEDDRGEGLCG